MTGTQPREEQGERGVGEMGSARGAVLRCAALHSDRLGRARRWGWAGRSPQTADALLTR